MAIELVAPTRNIISIIKAPVSFTDSWSKIGRRIQTVGMDSVLIWLDITINDSTDLYFRGQAIARRNDAALSGYSLPTEEIHTGVNKFYPKVYQLQKLEDQKVVFQIPTAKLIKYVDIEIFDDSGAVATRAVVNSMLLTAETN